VGTPVVTSNQNPHQEVGGEFAVYVDPKDVDGIVDGILKVLGDDNLKESLILGGLEQVKKFSWANTAEEIFKSL